MVIFRSTVLDPIFANCTFACKILTEYESKILLSMTLDILFSANKRIFLVFVRTLFASNKWYDTFQSLQILQNIWRIFLDTFWSFLNQIVCELWICLQDFIKIWVSDTFYTNFAIEKYLTKYSKRGCW